MDSNSLAPSQPKVPAGRENFKASSQDAILGQVSAEIGSIAKDATTQFMCLLPDVVRSAIGQPLRQDFDPKLQSQKAQESIYWQKRWRHAEVMRQQEKELSQLREQAQLSRVSEIQRQLSSVLVPSMSAFAKEVEIAAFNAAASPNIYTENFLLELMRTAAKISTRIHKASLWLAMFNARASKQQPFFMKNKNQMQVDSFLSQERRSSFNG